MVENKLIQFSCLPLVWVYNRLGSVNRLIYAIIKFYFICISMIEWQLMNVVDEGWQA